MSAECIFIKFVFWSGGNTKSSLTMLNSTLFVFFLIGSLPTFGSTSLGVIKNLVNFLSIILITAALKFVESFLQYYCDLIP